MEPGSSLALRNARISRPPFEISASYSWRNIQNKRDSCLLPHISPYTLSLSWEGLINRLYLKGRSPYYFLVFSSASLDSLGISPVTAWRRPVDHKVLESQCVSERARFPLYSSFSSPEEFLSCSASLLHQEGKYQTTFYTFQQHLP